MKKINILLGSGVSIGYLPSTVDLTKEILKYESEKEYWGITMLYEKRNNYRKIINIIYNNLCEYYKRNYIYADVNYEEIYYFLNEIYEYSEGKKYYPPLDLYIKDLFAHNLFDIYKNKDEISYIKVEILFKEIKQYIGKILREKLTFDVSKIKNHHKVLLELYKTKFINSLFILNHDTLIEDYLRMNNVEFNDGFYDFIKVNGYLDGYSFNRNLFNQNLHKLNLVKIHGSIDWAVNKVTHSIYSSTEAIFKMSNRDFPVDNLKLSVGTYNKADNYFYSVYLTYINFFYSELNNSEILITAGYGFKDTYINRIIDEWFNDSENKKLIIIDPYFENNVKSIYEIRNNETERTKYDLRDTFLRKLYEKNQYRIIGINKKYKDVAIEDIISSI